MKITCAELDELLALLDVAEGEAELKGEHESFNTGVHVAISNAKSQMYGLFVHSVLTGTKEAV